MSRLIHYSIKPLTEVYSVEQEDTSEMAFYRKPGGLWVSVEGEDDWKQWCTDSDFQVHCLVCATEVVLKDDARILLISTPKQLEGFQAEYGEPDDTFRSTHIDYSYIQWDRVARKYQGIIIAPYMWEHRMDMMWYYTWDCASGCIWDADAVAELRPIEQEQRLDRTA